MRTSNLTLDPPMEASKWLKFQVLVDAEEMGKLFKILGPFEIYLTGVLTEPGKENVVKTHFLDIYRSYIDSLAQGEIPIEASYRPYFNTIFTADEESLYALPTAAGRQLVRVIKPVLQLQAHSMDYSIHDNKFRPMIFGLDSILWGIQFSYPQLFLDPKTKDILNVDLTFPNTFLFKNLQKWVRKETVPTPFLIEKKVVHTPMRLGKACFPWINQHPDLIRKSLLVHT